MISYLPLLAAATLTDSPPLALQVTPCDAGEHYRFSKSQCDIQVYNNTDVPVRLSDIKAVLPADRPGATALVVAPRSLANLAVTVDLDKGSGYVNRYFTAVSDEVGHPVYKLVARAFIDTVLDDVNVVVNFGVVDLKNPLPVKQVMLSSSEVADLRATAVLSAPDYLNVSITEDGRAIKLTPKADIPWGLHDDVVKFAINVPQQHAESLRVRSDVHGAVVPAENPVDLGVLRRGKTSETLIRLTATDGKALNIGKTSVNGVDASVDVRPCGNGETGCSLLHLTLSPNQALGEIKGNVIVELPDYKTTLPVVVWGLMVRPETVIRSLSDKDPNTLRGALPDYSAASSAQKAISVEDAISATVGPQEPPAPPPGSGPLLTWRTANEANIHGYIVYRADGEQGPFLRVSPKTVPSVGAGEKGTTYQWRDTSATPGKTYWYQIGTIYNDGHKQQLTGPQRVVAK